MKDTGGPAFPSHGSMGEVAHEGMTLRDWLAGMAMQAINARPDYADTPADAIALDAYALADAMLAERSKE